MQPSILKELSDELNLPPQPVTDNYTSEEDVLYLEDMLQRIILTGDINADEFVTGNGRMACCVNLSQFFVDLASEKIEVKASYLERQMVL